MTNSEFGRMELQIWVSTRFAKPNKGLASTPAEEAVVIFVLYTTSLQYFSKGNPEERSYERNTSPGLGFVKIWWHFEGGRRGLELLLELCKGYWRTKSRDISLVWVPVAKSLSKMSLVPTRLGNIVDFFSVSITSQTTYLSPSHGF